MAIATPDDLIARYDEQTIKDLASDTGEPATSLSTDSKVLAALSDSEGEIKAAVRSAKMYDWDDVIALTGSDLAFVKRLECDLAMALLLSRRPEKYGTDFFKAIRERTDGVLKMLRSGERVFNIDGNTGAGLPTIDGPSAVDFENLNLITARTRNFYPNYGTRLPLYRT